eukprot:3728646-Pleurochrysis_carterae.AAC.2
MLQHSSMPAHLPARSHAYSTPAGENARMARYMQGSVCVAAPRAHCDMSSIRSSSLCLRT